jgi:hypothetical protein
MGSFLSSGMLLPLAAIGLICALRCITSWVAGIRILVIVTIFGGIVSLHLGSGALLVIFRDLFVVVPLYVAALSNKAMRDSLINLPAGIGLMLIVVIAYMGLSILNTTAGSLSQVVIGLKIWLLYIPFLLVGVALATRPEGMFSVFRTLLIWGMVACFIGLLQSFLVRLIGYQATMTFFFGTKAASVTQGFSWFSDAGGIFRIPGTFTFATQYSNFLYLLLTVATIESNADPEPRFRRYGTVAMFIVAFALLLSGSRATGLTVSAFFAGYFLFGLMRFGTLSLTPVAVIGAWAALQIIGFDPAALLSTGSRLLGFYSQTLVFQSISDALKNGSFGAGIGASTNAARYAVTGASGLSGQALLGFESYYAKIAAELGSIGLGLMVSFFAIVFARVASETLRSRLRPANAIVAPLAIYLAYNGVSFFKGSPLDQDPGNIFFWLTLGLLIGVSRTAPTDYKEPVSRGAVAMAAPAGSAIGDASPSSL